MERLTRAGAAAAASLAAMLALTPLSAQQVQSPSTTSTQETGGPRRSFEVASVKLNTSTDNRSMVGFQPGGRYVATGVPLRFLIRGAFRLQESQLVGLPDWTRSERYDITAKADVADPTPDVMNEMLQSLLAERFGLVAHRDTREMPVYDLVVARADGRLGPGLTVSTVDCEAMRGRGRGTPQGGPPPIGGPPSGGGVSIPLGRGVPPGGQGGGPGGRGAGIPAMPCMTRMMPGNVTASSVTLDQFATMLEPQVSRIVRNKTGLSDRYDFTLSYTPEQLAGGGRGGDAPQGDTAPSLYTALQEQLGLKLDSQRAMVDVLVVDRVERPTPD